VNPDEELEAAEAQALAATLAVTRSLVSLLELIRPLVERRARDDVRFGLLEHQVRQALGPWAGTPVNLRETLAELVGEL
jgi:hypothetical protein